MDAVHGISREREREEYRSRFLAIDRCASRFPNVSLGAIVGAAAAVETEGFTSMGIVSDTSKTEATPAAPSFPPPLSQSRLALPLASRAYGSTESPESAASNNLARFRLSRSLYLPRVSRRVPPHGRASDRRPEVKLQPRATNFRNSLSCRISHGNAHRARRGRG